MQVTAVASSAGKKEFFTLHGLLVLAEIVLILKFYSIAEVGKYLSSGDVAVTTTCISFWFDEKYSNQQQVCLSVLFLKLL